MPSSRIPPETANSPFTPASLLGSRRNVRITRGQAVLRGSTLIPLALLFASIYTTLGSGALFMLNFQHGALPLSNPDSLFPLLWAWRHPGAIGWGWSFALPLLVILLAHEAGHYFFCRKYGIRATLPYVLPAPTLAGTAGAVIRIQSPIPDREALFEVGIAGPIAGYLVAIPMTVLGILLSHPMTAATPEPLIALHQPLTITLIDRALNMIFPGVPRQIVPHPVLMASWIGIFVTSLNLIPAGQLDGGHILYAISPRWHRFASITVPIILLGMGILFWTGWLLWGAILLLPVMRHPRVPNFPRLQRRHFWLACAALLMLALTLLPAPFAGAGLMGLFR